MQTLTNQKSTTVFSWLLIGLNLYKRQPQSQGSLLPTLRSSVGRVGENPGNEVVQENVNKLKVVILLGSLL